MNQGTSNPNPTPQEEDEAKRNVERDVKTISNRGTEPTDDEYYRAFGIPKQQQNQVSGNSSQGSGSNVELIKETNNSDTNNNNNDNKQNIQQNKNVKSKGNEEVVVNDQNKDQDNQVVNDIFSGDTWQSFLPNAESKQQIDQQNQQGSIENVADNSSSSDNTKELKMPDPYDIAETMGIEFKPDESLDKDKDSYRVMRKYEEEKNEYLINLSHAKSEQNRVKAEQEKNKKELFNRQAKKLAEYDQLFKNNDGTPNIKKISALVTAVSKLETSDDALILLRKYYNIATMPSIVKDQNSDKNKDHDNNQKNDNTTKFSSSNFLGNRRLPFDVGVSQDDINELNSFYGS